MSHERNLLIKYYQFASFLSGPNLIDIILLQALFGMYLNCGVVLNAYGFMNGHLKHWDITPIFIKWVEEVNGQAYNDFVIGTCVVYVASCVMLFFLIEMKI